MTFRIHFIIFLLMIFLSEVFSQTTPAIILPDGSNGTVQLKISAIPSLINKEKFGYEDLSVYVKNKEGEYVSNAIQGRHSIEGDYLIFSPYFPFEMGMTYMVKTKHSNTDSSYYYRSFMLGEKPKFDRAKVERIYPSGSQLPENLLRFYIYFNTPMKKGTGVG